MLPQDWGHVACSHTELRPHHLLYFLSSLNLSHRWTCSLNELRHIYSKHLLPIQASGNRLLPDRKNGFITEVIIILFCCYHNVCLCFNCMCFRLWGAGLHPHDSCGIHHVWCLLHMMHLAEDSAKSSSNHQWKSHTCKSKVWPKFWFFTLIFPLPSRTLWPELAPNWLDSSSSLELHIHLGPITPVSSQFPFQLSTCSFLSVPATGTWDDCLPLSSLNINILQISFRWRKLVNLSNEWMTYSQYRGYDPIVVPVLW